MKTSINFKVAKSDSVAHNFRKKSFGYIRKDLTPKNEYQNRFYYFIYLISFFDNMAFRSPVFKFLFFSDFIYYGKS